VTPLSSTTSKRYWEDRCALCRTLPRTASPQPSKVLRTSRRSSSSPAAVPWETSDGDQSQNDISSLVLLPCSHHICSSCFSCAVTEKLQQGSVLENCPVCNVLISRNVAYCRKQFMHLTDILLSSCLYFSALLRLLCFLFIFN